MNTHSWSNLRKETTMVDLRPAPSGEGGDPEELLVVVHEAQILRRHHHGSGQPVKALLRRDRTGHHSRSLIDRRSDRGVQVVRILHGRERAPEVVEAGLRRENGRRAEVHGVDGEHVGGEAVADVDGGRHPGGGPRVRPGLTGGGAPGVRGVATGALAPLVARGTELRLDGRVHVRRSGADGRVGGRSSRHSRVAAARSRRNAGVREVARHEPDHQRGQQNDKRPGLGHGHESNLP